MKNTKTFYCGTSNVVLPVPNKAHFPAAYQDKSRLNYYGCLFNSVEINSSFYKIPMPATVGKWANDVPPDFRFTFKLWRGITHARQLEFDPKDIGRFLQAVNMAGTRKGCLLVQFPASIKISYLDRVRKLLDEIESENTGEWKIAVEFRDRSWYCDNVYNVLAYYNATLVIHDMPASATQATAIDTDSVYLRFHGEKGDYKGSYSAEYIRAHAVKIKDWIKAGKTVYAYFNNTLGEALHNAQTLSSYISINR